MNEAKKASCIKYLESRRYIEPENKLVIRTVEQLEEMGITDCQILTADPRKLIDILIQRDVDKGRAPCHKRRIMCINRYISFLDQYNPEEAAI